MKQRFASFLFAGKIAALPLSANGSLVEIQKILSKDADIAEKHESFDAASQSIRNLTTDKDKKVIFLPKNLLGKDVPRTLDLVLTGLYEKDEVMLLMSRKQDISRLLEIDPGFHKKLQDIEVLTHFSVIATSPDNSAIFAKRLQDDQTSSSRSLNALSLPVDLGVLYELTKDGSNFYIQVLVAPDSNWDKSVFRRSDLFELRSLDNSMLLSQSGGDITEDCTFYTCF
jgi:hypothetical protein